MIHSISLLFYFLIPFSFRTCPTFNETIREVIDCNMLFETSTKIGNTVWNSCLQLCGAAKCGWAPLLDQQTWWTPPWWITPNCLIRSNQKQTISDNELINVSVLIIWIWWALNEGKTMQFTILWIKHNFSWDNAVTIYIVIKTQFFREKRVAKGEVCILGKYVNGGGVHGVGI